MSPDTYGRTWPSKVQSGLQLADERKRLEHEVTRRHGYIAKMDRISDEGLRVMLEYGDDVPSDEHKTDKSSSGTTI